MSACVLKSTKNKSNVFDHDQKGQEVVLGFKKHRINVAWFDNMNQTGQEVRSKVEDTEYK